MKIKINVMVIIKRKKERKVVVVENWCFMRSIKRWAIVGSEKGFVKRVLFGTLSVGGLTFVA